MKRFLTFFIIIFLTDGFGQNLEMDAELIELNFQYSSDPTDFFHFQNQLFFRGKYKGIDDYSIFKYDGIDAVIMKNGGGERLICGAPIIGDNLLYFIGKIYDDFYGDHYLWVSNGEENDAIPLIESGGNYELLLTIGSRLFFLYSDPFEKKLWTSNGTPETTIQLMDLHTAPQNAGYVKNVIESQGKLFFSTDDPTYGEE